MKLLIVDDEQSARDNLKRSIDFYVMEHPEVKIEPIFCSSIDEANEKIDDDIDVAIVDLKLAGDGDEGNKVIQQIKSQWRILTFVLTGQPDNLSEEAGVIKIYVKGQNTHNEILNEIISIVNTGILGVIGRDGELEDSINSIFWKNIIPQMNSWTEHSKKALYDKKFLYRHILSQLCEELDDHGDFLPEEMYIYPPHDDSCKTGDIIKSAEGNIYIVLSPACDLVMRDSGSMKTEYVMLCRIDNKKRIQDFEKKKTKLQDKIESCLCEDECSCDEDRNKISMCIDSVMQIKKNTFSSNFHYLPTTSFFNGGIVNFRKVSSVKPNDLSETYTRTDIRVGKNFIKDVVSRFSSYYARQGQPDFHDHML
jgi:hypothetical protein